MRTIVDTQQRSGQYGPFHIVHFNDGTSCIVADKYIINPTAGFLHDFAKRGTNVKFNDGHKEQVGVDNTTAPTDKMDTLIAVLETFCVSIERIANALERNDEIITMEDS